MNGTGNKKQARKEPSALAAKFAVSPRTSPKLREVWEVVREMLDWYQASTRRGIEGVAEELSRRTGKTVQPRTVYRYQEADGLQIHLSTAIELSLVCESPALLRQFAHRLGYAVVRIPAPGGDLPDEVAEIIRALKETTEAIEVSGRAIEDGAITAGEMRGIDREIMEGIEELYTLREVLRGCFERAGGGR